jgi:hypothetical protein
VSNHLSPLLKDMPVGVEPVTKYFDKPVTLNDVPPVVFLKSIVPDEYVPPVN